MSPQVPNNSRDVEKYHKEYSRRPFLLKVPKMVAPVKHRPPTSQTNAVLKNKEKAQLNSKRGMLERDNSPTYSKDKDQGGKKIKEINRIKEMVLQTNSSERINIIHQNRNASNKAFD